MSSFYHLTCESSFQKVLSVLKMQVNCKVNVVNRLLPATGQTGNSRLVWSSIILSKINNKSEEVELTLASSRNKAGVKYKITKNIEQIFSKFLSQGKLTIRFIQPPHDLCLSGDIKQLEKILNVVKGDNKPVNKGTLCPLLVNSTSKVVIPKTKLHISSRANYPVTVGFPETLTTLKISGIALKKWDRRILHLKNLEILDLSENQITTLPESIDKLNLLKQLNLSRNEIKCLSKAFINSAKQLRNLDLSHNKLVHLPSFIACLENLSTMKLDHNNILTLPKTMARLTSLRNLTLASNKIKYLPVSFQKLKLDHVDVFGNPFRNQEDQLSQESLSSISNHVKKMPSLLSIAAKSTIAQRISYGEGDIPSTLITYLNESSTFCPCGELCIDDGIESRGSINLLGVSDSVSGDKIVPLEMTLCSNVCFQRFSQKIVH